MAGPGDRRRAGGRARTSTSKISWMAVSAAYRLNAWLKNWMTATEHMQMRPTLKRKLLMSVPFCFIGWMVTKRRLRPSVKLPLMVMAIR